MTVYYPLKCNNIYETFAYDLFGTLRFKNFRGKIKFLSRCRLTEKSCDRLCRKLNYREKKYNIEKAKEQLIEKVCDWLESNLCYYDENYRGIDSGNSLIEDFKKAMEE